jgi:hypothetical protein
VFNLLEAGGGAVSWLSGRSRKVTFQAPTVEECCEWASECPGGRRGPGWLGPRGGVGRWRGGQGTRTSSCTGREADGDGDQGATPPSARNPRHSLISTPSVALREGIALATTGVSPSGGSGSHRRTHSTHSSGSVPA